MTSPLVGSTFYSKSLGNPTLPSILLRASSYSHCNEDISPNFCLTNGNLQKTALYIVQFLSYPFTYFYTASWFLPGYSTDQSVKISLFFIVVAVNKILSVKLFGSILHYSQAKYRLSRSVKFDSLSAINQLISQIQFRFITKTNHYTR